MEKWGNSYERAFEAWLQERQMPYRALDQSRRREFDRHRIKTFDFAISPAGASLTLIDVKGRIFKGHSLEGLKNLQTWVTDEDIYGLEQWRQAIADRQPADAAFVFAYKLSQADVETDGLSVFEFEGERYVFLLVDLDVYEHGMKRRSPRWNTVYLPAERFRRAAVPLTEWVERHNEAVVNENNPC